MNRARTALLAGVPVAFAIASVLAGKDANWDFLNYRWYDAWAFLHGRLETDVLVANHATFYNPLLELPFYLVATHVPAILAGFLLALASTIVFVPLYLLAEEVLVLSPGSLRSLAPARGRGQQSLGLSSGDPSRDSPLPEGGEGRRLAAAGSIVIPAVIGLAGLLGGGVLGQIGIVSWDLPLGSLTLLALYVLVRDDAACLRFASRHSTRGLCLAGFLVGAAAGFKLTAAIYPVGLFVGLACTPRLSGLRRLWQLILFSVGTVSGMAVFGGYWMWRLYQAFGNPFFPYFNGFFHSAYAATGSNRDTIFLPQDWLTGIFFPYVFSANSHRVAEYDFRDIHIALLFTLLPILLLTRVWRRPAVDLVRPLGARFLLIGASVSYLAWEALFSIYRYILPLEALAPLLIVLAVLLLPLPVRARASVATACLVLGLVAIRVDFTRRPWDAQYVAVNLPFEVPANALVAMLGEGPMGYAATALPPTVPVLRITSYLAGGNRFADRIQQEITTHRGDFLAILPFDTETAANRALAIYGLKLQTSACGSITANIADPLLLCRVSREVDLQ